MFAGNWFGKRHWLSSDKKSQQVLSKGRRRKQAARGRSLRVEALEDRRMLAVFVVNNLGDVINGNTVTGSLRHAIELANANGEADSIVFEDYLFSDPVTGAPTPGIIPLHGGPLPTITDEVAIYGPGSSALTVSIHHANQRIFDINIVSNSLKSVTIAGMTLTGGNVPKGNLGGAIFNQEALTLTEVVITGNSAADGGGAIYQPSGTITLERSLVNFNSSGGGGGGIYSGSGGENDQGHLTIINSTIASNSTFGIKDNPGYGGGIFNRDGILTIENSTIVDNSSSAQGGGVSTYGATDPDPNEDDPVITNISNSILSGNTRSGTPDDILEVFIDIDDNLLFSSQTLDFNIIGSINGLAPFIDNLGIPHFYRAVATPELTWKTANQLTGSGDRHLATLTTLAESDYVFPLVDSGNLWRQFDPEEFGDPVVDPPKRNIGPWLGATQAGGGGPADNWTWVTGEPVVDLDPPQVGWAKEPTIPFPPGRGDQPDDAVLITDPMDLPIEEDRMSYFSIDASMRTPTWGDLLEEPERDDQTPLGFVVEYDQGTNYFAIDPLLQPLGDYGGSTPVYYPTSAAFSGNPLAVSPAIDAGGFSFGSQFSGRGRHFTRIFGAGVDIGAVEVQDGQFVVDALRDESDGQYSRIWEYDDTSAPPLPVAVGIYADEFPSFPCFPNSISIDCAIGATGGDFSLREAIEFSEKNPEFDTISFEPLSAPFLLQDLYDPTLASPAPTILLTLRSNYLPFFPPADFNSALKITQSVDILGPTTFELEIDASGNDPTPTVNNDDGSRLFLIDNDDFFSEIDVTINNLTLMGGDVEEAGGGILNRETLNIGFSTIKENASGLDGGGIYSQFGSLLLDSTTLNDNLADNNGGAVFIESDLPGETTSATLRNSTVSGNTAGIRGGGVYNYDGEVLIEFSTITLNSSAPTGGGGVASQNNPNAVTEIHSSIISENTGDDVRLLPGATTIHSLGFNLIGDGNASIVFNQTGDMTGVLDPMLAPLLKTGGLLSTHRLEAGSPAIDAGDPIAFAGVGNVPFYDQRGNPFGRVFDGLQDTKNVIDIGAYELQGSVFIVDSLLDENDSDISLGNFSLREAIELSNVNPLDDTIMFNPLLLGGTIFQTPANDFGGLLQPGTPTDMRITDSVTIIGLGKNFLTLDGTNAYVDSDDALEFPAPNPLPKTHFFTIDDNIGAIDIKVVISGIRFENSINVTENGAAISSVEDLTLESIAFVGNSTLGDGVNGGAVYQRYGSLLLDRVTLTANTTDGVDADGGAIYARDTDLTVRNNTIVSGNSTTQTLGSGGGIYIRDGVLNLSDSTISGNLAPGGEADGSGLFGFQSSLNVTNSIISNNSMTGSNSEGAGIFGRQSYLTLTDSIVSGNSTSGTQSEGAGIYLDGGSSTIERSLISLNSTTGQLSTGAGVSVVNGAVLVITDSTLDANTTTGINASGGGVHNLGSDVTVRNSTISNNSVSGTGSVGGGVFNSTDLSGNLTTILNSTISGNSSASQGGGIYNAVGLTRILHSTITDNSAPLGLGGGVASVGNSLTQTEVQSSIIAGNFANNTPGSDPDDVDRVSGGSNSFLSLNFNLIGSGLAVGAFNQSGDQTGVNDPKLGPLADNGGTTDTHALLDDSPAIGAGNSAFNPNAFNPALTTDQRGTARVLDGQIDIGAFETLAAADFDQDEKVDGFDFLAWQRGFGTATGADKADGDADNDGDVDGIDLDKWKDAYGDPQPVSALALSLEASVAASVAPPVADEVVLETVSTQQNSLQQTTTQRIVAGLFLTAPQPLSSSIIDTGSLTNGSEVGLAARDELIARLSVDSVSHRVPAGNDDLGELELLDSLSEDAAGEEQFLAEDLVFEQLGSGEF